MFVDSLFWIPSENSIQIMLRIYLIILFSVSCSFFLNGIAIILVTQAKEKTDREDFKVELSLHVFFVSF